MCNERVSLELWGIRESFLKDSVGIPLRHNSGKSCCECQFVSRLLGFISQVVIEVQIYACLILYKMLLKPNFIPN